MDEDIPYIPIKQFESENLRKLIETASVGDENEGFGVSTFNPTINTHSRSESSNNGDSYSDSVDLILEGMGLGKYIDNFKAHDIGLNILLHMTTSDLTVIGVTNPKDQACFRKHLLDFNGGPTLTNNDLYKIEEDLIMARNVCTHLEDINAHLNFIQFNLKKNDYEDYFVNPKNSILRVFDIVINRTLTQARRMSDVLFSGSFSSDNLVGACLKADGLELPEFMVVKLYNPDRDFKLAGRKFKRWAIFAVKAGTAFAVGLSASVYMYRRYIKK